MLIQPASPNGLGNRSSLSFDIVSYTGWEKEWAISNHNHMKFSPRKEKEKNGWIWNPQLKFRLSESYLNIIFHHARYGHPKYYLGNSWYMCETYIMTGSALGKSKWRELDPFPNFHGFLAPYKNYVLWWAGVANAGY